MAAVKNAAMPSGTRLLLQPGAEPHRQQADGRAGRQVARPAVCRLLPTSPASRPAKPLASSPRSAPRPEPGAFARSAMDLIDCPSLCAAEGGKDSGGGAVAGIAAAKGSQPGSCCRNPQKHPATVLFIIWHQGIGKQLRTDGERHHHAAKVQRQRLTEGPLQGRRTLALCPASGGSRSTECPNVALRALRGTMGGLRVRGHGTRHLPVAPVSDHSGSISASTRLVETTENTTIWSCEIQQHMWQAAAHTSGTHQAHLIAAFCRGAP